MWTLYYSPGACSFAPHVALEELGRPFETQRITVADGMQHTAEYRAVNPMGYVPALATEHGVLTECPAILSFVADAADEGALLPSDAFQRAQALSMLAYLSSHVHVAFAHIFRPNRFTDEVEAGREPMKAKAFAVLGQAFAHLDQRVAGREWLFDRFSVADPYLAIFRRWAWRVGLDLSPYPNVVAHAARVASRPSGARALEREGIRLDG